MPRCDPLDPGFSSSQEAVDTLIKPWTLTGASGSNVPAEVMHRVDSIAPDHGETLINQLRALPRTPAVVLLLESTAWLQVNAYPMDRVDAVVRTQSFGSGVLIEALRAVNRGHRYVDPALVSALKANTRTNQLQLTPREQQTLEELAKGLTNREIAQRLGIAETTTREYTRSVLQKLNVRNRTMAVGAAMKQP